MTSRYTAYAANIAVREKTIRNMMETQAASADLANCLCDYITFYFSWQTSAESTLILHDASCDQQPVELNLQDAVIQLRHQSQ